MHDPRVVLVTGGAGFIGSNLLHHLVPQYKDIQFINLDALTYAGHPASLTSIESAENYEFVQGDIADPDLVRRLFAEYDVSSVIHLAAESHVDRSIMDPIQFVRTNVNGTAILLEAAREFWSDMESEPYRYRFYHVSTDEVYGSLGETGSFDENTAYDPHSPYSASKAGADHLVRAYGRTYDLPFVISNCTNNYGPYQYPEKLTPLVIRNAVEGRAIPVYGTGKNIRDWLHVEDHCAAIERILINGRNGETYPVGGGAEETNLAFVQRIADLVDEALNREQGWSRELIEFVDDRPGHDFRYAMDSTKTQQELGWSPNYTLEEGLQYTVNWYLSNQEWTDTVLNESYEEYYSTQYSRPTTHKE